MSAEPSAAATQDGEQAPSMEDRLNVVLQNQKSAFEREPAPTLTVRLDRLERIAKLLKARGEDFCQAISRDFGHRSSRETRLLEITPLMAAIRHTRTNLASWMRPQKRDRSFEFLSLTNWVEFQPLGVVGIMAPWNYPLVLSLGPLVDVLAAGNRAMIKPSELLPETSSLLATALSDYFSQEEVAVVEGGADVGAAFAELPFDHLLFTGSTAVGRKVMAAAAKHLTPVTLELGGKSPALIAPDYPLARAARDIVFGKMMNAGQTCIAPDYVLVEEAKLDALGDLLVKQIKKAYPKKNKGRDYTSLVGAGARMRLEDAIAQCRGRGVRILEADLGPVDHPGVFTPTIVLDPPQDCALMQEEIFGPVLPLVPYRDPAEAIAFIRNRPRPLALYLFTKNRTSEQEMLLATHSGNVTINGTLLHIAQNDLPFGGIGQSGIGAYHGRDGFQRFSHIRGISKVGSFNPARLAMPPYGWLASLVSRFVARR